MLFSILFIVKKFGGENLKIIFPLAFLLIILIGVACVSATGDVSSHIADGCHHALEKINDSDLNKNFDISNMAFNGELIPFDGIDVPSNDLVSVNNLD
jgi:hypothetical protein